ncbi:hypothetical protein DL769_002157 [Monosporascus sp. CRB-8-3]|nr:hypothetical protein DL769_002157 [Monosporascus sp. CRB-8-3]
MFCAPRKHILRLLDPQGRVAMGDRAHDLFHQEPAAVRADRHVGRDRPRRAVSRGRGHGPAPPGPRVRRRHPAPDHAGSERPSRTGYASSDENGHRERLRSMNVGHGSDSDMPGAVIDGVCGRAEVAFPQQYRPNVYLIDAGTNDCAPDIDIPNTGRRMGALVDYLYGSTPEAAVQFSTLLRNGPSTAAMSTNSRAPRRVARGRRSAHRARRLPGRGRPRPPAASGTACTPATRGNAEMARVWFNGLLDADARAFLQEVV